MRFGVGAAMRSVGGGRGSNEDNSWCRPRGGKPAVEPSDTRTDRPVRGWPKGLDTEASVAGRGIPDVLALCQRGVI